MRWDRVCVEGIGVSLPDERVSTRELEERIGSVYRKWGLAPGQLEAMTGIRERRWWPAGGVSLSGSATDAARDALAEAGMGAAELGVVIYAGVNRENLEPATACPVAHKLGVREDALVLDVSNACLGVLNGMALVANMIELGQVRAGLVVAAESAREIADDTIDRILGEPTHATFRTCIASLTGGSGAVAVVLTDSRDSLTGRRLVGGAAVAATQHHEIARWGPRTGLLGREPWVMETDATAVLTHGVELGRRTWERFLPELGWTESDIDKVICHQVGVGHRDAVLPSLGIDVSKDFSTFSTLGNMGPVALPATAAIATSQGFLSPGDRVAFLGIGTGLNCMMLGLLW
ncbi:MAG: 3-oxoacyl-ACP synthase III [Deltaproteobacteria bacterium]|nr:3-oxoacyl-ACP synthase III [Deltaproteobacteria bacterium]